MKIAEGVYVKVEMKGSYASSDVKTVADMRKQTKAVKEIGTALDKIKRKYLPTSYVTKGAAAKQD